MSEYPTFPGFLPLIGRALEHWPQALDQPELTSGEYLAVVYTIEILQWWSMQYHSRGVSIKIRDPGGMIELEVQDYSGRRKLLHESTHCNIVLAAIVALRVIVEAEGPV